VRLLDESYTLLARSGGGYVLLSQGEIHVPGQTIGLSQETEYDRDYAPSSYDLAVETKDVRQSIAARSDRSGFAMEARAGLVHQSNTIKDAGKIALLDNNVVSHYAVLLLALRAGALGKAFTGRGSPAPCRPSAKVEGPENVQFRSGDVVFEGAATRVHIGDTTIVLVEREGRLVGLVTRRKRLWAMTSTSCREG